MEPKFASQVCGEGRVVLETKESFAILRLGEEHEGLVVFSKERMRSLSDALNAVSRDSKIQGLVIIGANNKGFCAGIDLADLEAINDPAVAEEMSQLGQSIFRKLSSLSCRTVAAVCGPCIGAGCELALRCDFRILLNSPETRIGLPEVRLGLLPAFGGTQTLPRVVGLRAALHMMMKGKTISSERAHEIGLADTLVERDGNSDMYSRVQAVAREVALARLPLSRRKLGPGALLYTHTAIGRSIVCSEATLAIERKVGGVYPAPRRTKEVVLSGLQKGEERGLKEESSAFGELISHPVTKSLLHLYRVGEDAKRLGGLAEKELASARVAILGASSANTDVAASFLARGMSVQVIDPSSKALLFFRRGVEGAVSRIPERTASIGEGLSLSESLSDISGATVVIESVEEDSELKKEILSQAARLVGNNVVIASNTYSFSVNELSTAILNPSRFSGICFGTFFNSRMFAEVVRGRATGNRALAVMAAICEKAGRYPLVVEDGCGFLVNRLLFSMVSEACHFLSEGYSVESVDALACGFGLTSGPFCILDDMGLDVAGRIADQLSLVYGSRMFAPNYSEQLAARGRFGRKSGAGYYLYQDGAVVSDRSVKDMLDLPFTVGERMSESSLQLRLVLPAINEAVCCLDEGVSGIPGPEAAGQIDLASVIGMTFPSFLGGLLHYAESLGAEEVCAMLSEYAERYGDRFLPCAGVVERAKRGIGFFEAI